MVNLEGGCVCPVPLLDDSPLEWKSCWGCGLPFNGQCWAESSSVQKGVAHLRMKLNIQTAFLVNTIMECGR